MCACICVCFYPQCCIPAPCRAGSLEYVDTARWGPAGPSASSASSGGPSHRWRCCMPTRGTSPSRYKSPVCRLGEKHTGMLSEFWYSSFKSHLYRWLNLLFKTSFSIFIPVQLLSWFVTVKRRGGDRGLDWLFNMVSKSWLLQVLGHKRPQSDIWRGQGRSGGMELGRKRRGWFVNTLSNYQREQRYKKKQGYRLQLIMLSRGFREAEQMRA